MGIDELSLEQARKRLKQLEMPQETKEAVWKRFDEIVSRMSNDQQAFVNANEKAVSKRRELMETFNNWLFERYKDEFVQNPMFATLADEYVDVVAETAQEFGQKTAGLARENEELRRQLAELQAKQGDKLL